MSGARPTADQHELVFNFEDCWQVTPTEDGALFLRSLPLLVDEGAVVYFEGSRSRVVSEQLARMSVPAEAVVHQAMIWPRPDRHHLRASPAVLEALASFLESQSDRRLCYHCHVYHEGGLTLSWYDAFADPSYVDGGVGEEHVLAFAEAIGTTASRFAG